MTLPPKSESRPAWFKATLSSWEGTARLHLGPQRPALNVARGESVLLEEPLVSSSHFV